MSRRLSRSGAAAACQLHGVLTVLLLRCAHLQATQVCTASSGRQKHPLTGWHQKPLPLHSTALQNAGTSKPAAPAQAHQVLVLLTIVHFTHVQHDK